MISLTLASILRIFKGERNTFILLKWEQKPVEQNSQIVEGYREVGMMK